MADTARAIGFAAQTTIGTPATVTTLNPFVTEFGHDPHITWDTPDYKTNTRLVNTRNVAKTRYDEVDVKGRVDNLYINPLLASAFGPAVSGVYKFGLSTNATPTSFLTAKWSEGLAQSWLMSDARVSTMELMLDAANGTFEYSAKLRGLGATPTLTLPTWTTPTVTGDLPFGAWQVTCKKGAAFICVASFSITLDNHFEPYYCTPVVVPGSTTEAGLPPTRFTDGMATGTFKLTYEYLGDAASSFYNFRHQVDEDWHITATEPVGGATFTIDIPNVGWTVGKLDRSKPNVLQDLTGSLLLDATAGTSILITEV